MGILEKISDIEKEIAKTQKNKGKLKTTACCVGKISLYK
jgi:ribosome-interacting GTPase 1